MKMRTLSAALVALALLTGIPGPGLAQSADAASATRPAMSTSELMRATALDEIFSQFGASIEASPAEQGVPLTAALGAAWSEASREAFAPEPMHADLARALEDKFTPDDYAAFADFFHSDLGTRVTEIERAVTALGPDAQLAAREVGVALAQAGAGSDRADRIDEMLKLVSADIAKAMVRHAVRGMMLGMYVNGQQGDIRLPWDEIDAHLDIIMPGIEAEVAVTQEAIMFFAYKDLTDAELDRYLEFLRTEPARKFYAVAAYLIGEIVAERMETFGETLARMLDRVSV